MEIVKILKIFYRNQQNLLLLTELSSQSILLTPQADPNTNLHQDFIVVNGNIVRQNQNYPNAIQVERRGHIIGMEESGRLHPLWQNGRTVSILQSNGQIFPLNLQRAERWFREAPNALDFAQRRPRYPWND